MGGEVGFGLAHNISYEIPSQQKRLTQKAIFYNDLQEPILTFCSSTP